MKALTWGAGLVTGIFAGYARGMGPGIWLVGLFAATDPLAIFTEMVAPQPEARAAGVARAGQTREPLFVDPLRAALLDRSPQVRRAGAEALGELGVPRTAEDLAAILGALERAVHDPDATVAEAAVGSLARFPFPEVRQRLLRFVKDSRLSAGVRERARRVLATAPDLEAKSRLAAYLELTVGEAARAGAAGTLEPLPASELERFGRWPAAVLGARSLLTPELGPHRVGAEALAQLASPELLPFYVHALGEPEPEVRRPAARALARLDQAVAWKALQPALIDPDFEVRLHAVIATARRGDDEAARALVQRFVFEVAPSVVTVLRETIATQNEAVVLAALWPWPPNAPPGRGALAVDYLGTRSSTAARSVLVQHLAGEDASTAEHALTQVRQRSDPEVVSLLLDALRNSKPDQEPRRRVLQALEGRTDPRIGPALVSLLGADRGDRAVLAALGPRTDFVARAQLLTLLPDARASVRSLVLEAVGDLRGPDVVASATVALAKVPQDDGIFELLLRQEREAAYPALLGLLGSQTHQERHLAILEALEGRVDEALVAPAVEATLRNPDLAWVSLPLLEQQRPEVAADALERIAASQALDPSLRARAVRSLAALPRTEVESRLRPLALDDAFSVRLAARNALHTLAPNIYPSWDPYGRWPLIGESAAFGATLLLLLREIAQTELSPAFIGGVGSVLGGATPFLLTLGEDVTLGDAGYFGTLGLQGTLGGYALGALSGQPRERRLWLTIGGELLGVGLAGLTMKHAEWGLEEVALAQVNAAEGFAVGLGLQLLLDREATFKKGAHAGMAGGALATIPVAILARRLTVSEDLPLLATTMGHGAWLGAFAPAVWHNDRLTSKDAALGILMGQGLGWFTGLTWAQFQELPADAALDSGYGAMIGAATFGGLGLMLHDASPRIRYGLLEVGSLAGALTLGILGEELQFYRTDSEIVALMAVGGALAASDFSVRLEEGRLKEQGFVGGLLLGAGAGTAAGLVLTQFIDLPERTLYRSLGGAGLLALAGFGLGNTIPNLSVRERSRFSSVGLATGLALTLPFAESLQLDWEHTLLATVAAGHGGFLGAYLPNYLHSENEALPKESRVYGATFGAALGAATALAVAQATELKLSRVGSYSFGALASTGLGGGLALLIPNSDRRLDAGLIHGFGLAGLAGGSIALAAGVRGGGSGQGAERFFNAMAFTAQGALLGAPLGYLLHKQPEDRAIGGGVVTGASMGMLAGLGAGLVLREPLPGDVLLEATTWSLPAFGVGAGLAWAKDQRLGAAVAQGLGAALYLGALGFSSATDFEVDLIPSLSVGATIFGWMGGFAPALNQSFDRKQVGGGLLAGASLGLLGGAVWNQLEEDRSEIEVLAAFAAATGIGGGYGLTLKGARAQTVLTMEVGSLVGLATALALSPYTQYSAGDPGLIGYATLFGAVQGFAWSAWDYADGQERGGAALMGAGAGLLGGMALAQWLSPAGEDVAETGAGGLLGMALGTGIYLVLPSSDRRDEALSLSGGLTLGTALGALWAPLSHYSSEDAYLMLLLGGAGAFHGTFAAPIIGGEMTSVRTPGGTLMGAALGAGAGAVLSQMTELTVSDVTEGAYWTTLGTVAGGGLSLMAGATDRESALALNAGGLGALALGLALAPRTEYQDADIGLMVMGTGLGLWHGLWAGRLATGTEAGRRYGGGALLGTALGTAGMGVVSQFTEVPSSGMIEGGAGWLTFSAIGLGVAGVSERIEGRDAAWWIQGSGLLGLGLGLGLSSQLELKQGDLALVTLGTLLGGAAGASLPAAFDGQASRLQHLSGASLGAGVGALASITAAQWLDFDFSEVGEGTLFALGGYGAGTGLSLLIPNASTPTKVAVANGLGLGSLGLGLALAPATEYDADTAASLGLGAVWGGTLGLLSPAWWNGPSLKSVPGQAYGGGLLLGTSAGLAAGLLLDQTFELEARTRRRLALGAAAGALSGGGISLMASRDDRAFVTAFSATSVLGGAVVAATAPEAELTWGNFGLGSAYVGYLGWHALGLTLLFEGTDRQAAGVGMATLGLGAVTGLYFVPKLDLELADVLMLLTGNVWGTWIGGWTGALIRDELNDVSGRKSAGLGLVATVLGSDLGLALTSLMVSGLFDVEPTRFAVINLAGLGGMTIGMLVAGSAKQEPLKLGNVVGSATGLLAGAVITSFFDWKTSPSWDQLLSKQSAPDPAKRVGGQAPLTIEQWFPSAAVEPGPDGEARYMFTIQGTLR